MARAEKTKQDLRSEATRRRLVAAARTLFTERGYAGVGTEEIVQAAGVTRGALYYQFRDKSDLFAAVAETVHAEIAQRITAGAQADGPTDPMAALHAGVQRFLEVCADPAVERIILLDAPAVLGWHAWRDLADRYGLGLLQHALQAAIDAGAIPPNRSSPSPTCSSAPSTSAPCTSPAPTTPQPPARNARPSSSSCWTASHPTPDNPRCPSHASRSRLAAPDQAPGQPPHSVVM
jgi:AcrR family transcriptional regulator